MSNKGRRLPAKPLTPGEVKTLTNDCSKLALTSIRNRLLLVVLD